MRVDPVLLAVQAGDLFVGAPVIADLRTHPGIVMLPHAVARALRTAQRPRGNH
jgi:hypothetical protein